MWHVLFHGQPRLTLGNNNSLLYSTCMCSYAYYIVSPFDKIPNMNDDTFLPVLLKKLQWPLSLYYFSMYTCKYVGCLLVRKEERICVGGIVFRYCSPPIDTSVIYSMMMLSFVEEGFFCSMLLLEQTLPPV